MAQERADPDQAALAREVQQGKREITASQPKERPGTLPGDKARANVNDSKSAAYAQATEAAKGAQGKAYHTGDKGPPGDRYAGNYDNYKQGAAAGDKPLSGLSADAKAQATAQGNTLAQKGVRAGGEGTHETGDLNHKGGNANSDAAPKSGVASDAQTSQNASAGGSRLAAVEQRAAASAPAPSPSSSPSMKK